MPKGEKNSFDQVIEARERIKTQVVSRLEEFQQKCDIWGHGVSSREVADQILQKGLFVQGSTLHDFSYELPKNPDSLAHKLQGWDYQGRRVVVLIATPPGFESTDVGGYDVRKQSQQAAQKDHILEPVLREDNMADAFKNRVPSKKIIGYIDVDNLDFVVNSNFEDRV